MTAPQDAPERRCASVDLWKLAVDVRAVMNRRGVSLRTAAREIGMAPSGLTALLRYQDTPSLPVFARIVRWAGLVADSYIVRGEPL